MGELATQTTVTVKVENGQAILRAANSKRAGLMTAEQAQAIETLQQLLASGEFVGGQTVVQQVRPAMLKPQLQEVDLSLPPPSDPVQILGPNHSDGLGRRLQELEGSAVSKTDHVHLLNAMTGLRDEVAKRLDKLESRVAALESSGPDSAEIEEMRAQHLIIQEMINDPTPVMVEANDV